MITRTYPEETWRVIECAMRMAAVTLATDPDQRTFADTCRRLADELAQPQAQDHCIACGTYNITCGRWAFNGYPCDWIVCHKCGSTIRVVHAQYVSPNHTSGDENLPGRITHTEASDEQRVP